MSDTENIAVPPPGHIIKEERGLTLWRPTVAGIAVDVQRDGIVCLHIYRDGSNQTFLLSHDEAAHLAGLMTRGPASAVQP